MKKPLFLFTLALAAWGGPLDSSAEAPPLFSPEPPEPAAAALVETYLPLLAAGQFEQALALNDLRGMRQYLLERRLDDLKARNPELTAQDIGEMSAQLQTNELNPLRLQEILLKVMRDSSFEGMTWRIRGFAPAPEKTGGHLVSIEARTAGGQEKPILLGIKKLGEQWMVAPEIIEELMGQKPVVRVVPSTPPPAEVAAVVDAFWKHWQTGELNDAYALFGAPYREKVPLLSFLQEAQEFIARIGVPVSWKIEQSREIAPSTLGLGVVVQGSTSRLPTIMLFKKMGETWVLMDGQFRMPASAPADPAPPAGAETPAKSSAFRTDLRPDLGSGSIPPAVPAPDGPADGELPPPPNAPAGPESR